MTSGIVRDCEAKHQLRARRSPRQSQLGTPGAVLAVHEEQITSVALTVATPSAITMFIPAEIPARGKTVRNVPTISTRKMTK